MKNNFLSYNYAIKFYLEKSWNETMIFNWLINLGGLSFARDVVWACVCQVALAGLGNTDYIIGCPALIINRYGMLR